MMNRQVVKHLAFALIGAAVVAEILAVSAIAASSDSTVSLWTAAPFHQVHFAAIAAYSSVVDYAGQLIATLNLTSLFGR
jgi:hypothetical protein